MINPSSLTIWVPAFAGMSGLGTGQGSVFLGVISVAATGSMASGVASTAIIPVKIASKQVTSSLEFVRPT